jgi:hypothetical protein
VLRLDNPAAFVNRSIAVKAAVDSVTNHRRNQAQRQLLAPGVQDLNLAARKLFTLGIFPVPLAVNNFSDCLFPRGFIGQS